MGTFRPLSHLDSSAPRSRNGLRLAFGIGLLLPVVLATGLAQGRSMPTRADGLGERVNVLREPAKSASTVHTPIHAGRKSSSGDLSSLQAAAQYHVFDSLINGFSYYTNEQEPFIYDAASGMLATIKRGSVDGTTSNRLYLRTSTDLGVTWADAVTLYDGTKGDARYPSFKFVRPNNSSNPADILIFFTAPIVAQEKFGSFVSGLVDVNHTNLVTTVSNPIGGLTWSTSSKNVVTADGKFVLSAGELSENNIGLRRFDVSTGDISQMVPPQWAADKYSDPGSPTSRTSVGVNIGTDAAGSVYYGVFSRFPVTDDIRIAPVPALSKSTDNGLTWSEFETMPISALKSYAATQGANPDSVLLPYNQSQDMIVTGTNQVSFLVNMMEFNTDKDAANLITQLVEVYRNNGDWGVRKIADVLRGEFQVRADQTADTLSDNQLSNEVQFARTADGTRMVAKWVDETGYIFQGDINDDGDSPDTLSTTDVMMATRTMGADNWSATANATNSPIFDRITWIPQTLPNDLSNIPLLTLQRNLNEVDVPTVQDSLFGLQLFVVEPQVVTISSVDISSVAGVDDRTASSASGMRLGSPTPNPATNAATVAFNLVRAGDAALEVWNSVGQRVLSLNQANLEAGDHTVSVDLSDLRSGAYYFTLRSNGETLTRMFSVVR